MDGYEVTRQIKADPAMRSIPIIAVTSHALDGEEQTARAAGCDGYVPEPYSPRQLLAKIQQCMYRSSAQSNSIANKHTPPTSIATDRTNSRSFRMPNCSTRIDHARQRRVRRFTLGTMRQVAGSGSNDVTR
jgi:DNA-binding response OmpR family regulator